MTGIDGVMYERNGTFTASVNVGYAGQWTGTGDTKRKAAEDLVMALANRLETLCAPKPNDAAEVQAQSLRQRGARILELEEQVARQKESHERVKDGLINDLNTKRREIAELQVQLSQVRSTLGSIGAMAMSEARAKG